MYERKKKVNESLTKVSWHKSKMNKKPKEVGNNCRNTIQKRKSRAWFRFLKLFGIYTQVNKNLSSSKQRLLSA